VVRIVPWNGASQSALGCESNCALKACSWETQSVASVQVVFPFAMRDATLHREDGGFMFLVFEL